MKAAAALSVLVLAAAPTALVTQSPQNQAPPAEAPSGRGVVGDWAGALDLGAVQLRLGLSVIAATDGALTAVVDSVDQGAKVPVEAVTFEAPSLRLSMPSIGASYAGTLSDDGSTLDGTWTQGGRQLPLVLHRGAAPQAPRRPQEPLRRGPAGSSGALLERLLVAPAEDQLARGAPVGVFGAVGAAGRAHVAPLGGESAEILGRQDLFREHRPVHLLACLEVIRAHEEVVVPLGRGPVAEVLGGH